MDSVHAMRIFPLQEAAFAAPESLGGKALNLGKLVQAGYAVPPGIVLDSTTCAALKTAFTDASLQDILEALTGIPGPYAVRSSGAAEDGSIQSWAGQYETVLQVQGGETLRNAILHCIHSADSARARMYGGETAGRIAVIIQQMVPATAAGVIFTANPATGERGCMVVNAAPGTGDRLVSGEISPDEAEIRGDEIRILRQTHGVLNAELLHRLCTLAAEVASRMQAPQDIEWALAGDHLWLLQTRPITALPPEPIPIPLEIPKGTWTRDDHHFVPTPLSWDIWHDHYGTFMAQGMREEYGLPIASVDAVSLGGHLYGRMKMQGPESSKVPPAFVLWLVSRLLPPMWRMNRKARILLRDKPYRKAIADWETQGRAYFQDKLRDFAPEKLAGLSPAAKAAQFRKLMDLARKGCKNHADVGMAGFMTFEFLIFMREHAGWKPEFTFLLFNGHSRASTAVIDEIAALCAAHFTQESLRQVYTPGDDVYALALAHPAFEAAVRTWMQDNRYRMLHYDVHNLSLGEQPGLVWENVRTALNHLHAGAPVRTAAAGVPQAEMAAAMARIQAAGRMAEYEDLYHWAVRGYASRDDNGLHTVSNIWGCIRLNAIAIARELPLLQADPSQIVYLREAEIYALLQGQLPDAAALLQRRRGEAQWARLNQGPRVYGPPPPPSPDPAPFPAPMRTLFSIFGILEELEMSGVSDSADAGSLRGRPACAGRIRGTARVVHSPAEFSRVQPGDILVCRITSPEWAVLFPRIRGIVTEEGGFLSHPAILAREFGIPAVLGAANVLKTVRDGQQITVDGGTGMVLLG